MTIDQIISVSANIALWITAILILCTLLVMNKQRKESIKPLLVPNSAKMFCYQKEHVGLLIPTEWRNKRESKSQDSFTSTFNIQLNNLGLGAAKDIVIIQQYDIDELINRTKAYNELIQIVKHEDSFLIKIQKYTYVNPKYNIKNLDYLLPSSIDKTGSLLVLDNMYKILASIQIQQGLEDNSSDFPLVPLTIQLKYKDISNNEYSNIFNGNIEMFVGRNPTKENELCFEGQLVFNS